MAVVTRSVRSFNVVESKLSPTSMNSGGSFSRNKRFQWQYYDYVVVCHLGMDERKEKLQTSVRVTVVQAYHNFGDCLLTEIYLTVSKILICI